MKDMMGTAIYSGSSALQDESEREIAREASRALARLADKQPVHVKAKTDAGVRQSFVLPASAVRLLTDMLTHLADGQAVAVIPEDAELTTQQAADMLNISRPYLIKFLVEENLPFTLVGRHRRIKFRDLSTFRDALRKRSSEALDKLVEQAQDLDMGY